MNVWKMNLKDNRDEIPENLKQSKFIFCREKGIVGIGWVGYDESVENTKDIGYEETKNNILSFRENDLVWVKNPETKEYYLCKIKSQVQYTKEDEYNKNDISMYCECDYQYIGTADNLPKEITKQDLVSIGTISKVNEQVSIVTLSLYNTEEPKKSSKFIKTKDVIEKIIKHTLKYKWIYLSAILALCILLAIITTINSIHRNQEKEIIESLANKTFVTDDYCIREFNNKGQFIFYSVQLTDNGKEIENLVDFNDFLQDYDIEITLSGQKYFTGDGRQKIQVDENNNVVSIGDYYPIDEEFKKMLDDYYLKLKEEKEKKENEEKEEKEIKSYLPNKDEFYERVLQVFPEVGSWQLFGNSESLYMDPNNSKNFMLLNETSTLTFNDGSNRVTFINSNNRIMVTEQKGKLTEERYNQLIKMAFGDAPDNLKICDLATFKQLTDTEEKVYPTDHSAKFKGMTYRWYVSYSNGAYNGYNFFIDYK